MMRMQGRVSWRDDDNKRLSFRRLFSSAKSNSGLLSADEHGLQLYGDGIREVTDLKGVEKRNSIVHKTLGGAQDIEDARIKSKGKGWFAITFKSAGGPYELTFKAPSSNEAAYWVRFLLEWSSGSLGSVPCVVALGNTGVGKSALLAALAGDFDDSREFFVSGGDVNGVTQGCESRLETWHGQHGEERCLLVDVPGLNDRAGDRQHIRDMIAELTCIGHCNAFMLVMEGANRRITEAIVRALSVFEQILGRGFWAHVVVVFTKSFPSIVPTDDASRQEIRQAFQEDLEKVFPALREVPRDHLPCVFVDSKAAAEHGSPDEAAIKTLAATVAAMPPYQIAPLHESAVAEIVESGNGQAVSNAAQHEILRTYLRQRGLEHKFDVLTENSVSSVSVLEQLRFPELKFLGFDEADYAKLRKISKVADEFDINANPDQVVSELAAVGLSEKAQGCLKDANLDARGLFRFSNDGLQSELGFSVPDLAVLRKWKTKVLKGRQVFADEIIFAEALVVRGGNGWRYSDEPLPQDGRGPGRVLAWYTLNGEKGGVSAHVPKRPGYCTVKWLANGWVRTYRIGYQGLYDLRFESDEDLDMNDAVDGVVRLTPTGEVDPACLRCTHTFACGLRFPHLAKFDIRPEICKAVGGFEHGDVVTHPLSSDEEVCIGVKLDEVNDEEVVLLWFQTINAPEKGAGIFGRNETSILRLVRKNEPVPERSDLKDAEWSFIDNDDRDWVKTQMKPTFRYYRGVNVGELELFDISPAVVDMFGLHRHGDVLRDKVSGKSQTCIGVLDDDNGQPQLWYHVETSAGAGISQQIHMNTSRFQFLGNNPPPQAPEEGNVPRPSRQQVQHVKATLNRTQEFYRGVGMNQDIQLFDVSPEHCNIMGGCESGSVYMGPDGKTVTAIGVRLVEETGEPEMWWLHQDHQGAGVLPNWWGIKRRFQKLPRLVNVQSLFEQMKARRTAGGSGPSRSNRARSGSTSSGTDLGLEGFLGLLQALSARMEADSKAFESSSKDVSSNH